MPTISPEEIFPGKLTGNYWGPGKLLYDSCQYGKSNLFTCMRCVLSTKKHFFHIFLEGGGGHEERDFEVCFKVCYGFAAQDR